MFEKEGKKEAVMGICEYEKKEAGGVISLGGKRCMEHETLFYVGDGVLD